MATSSESGEPLSDADLVRILIGHMVDPCETEAGNLRSFYIREGERLLSLDQIQDTVAKEKLQTALKLARIFDKADNGGRS